MRSVRPSAPGRSPRTRLRRGALVTLLACTAAAARAAQDAQSTPAPRPVPYAATWWNIANGLPQSSINALVQNERGEMWIATHGGLLCFDGVEFRRFDLDTLPGLHSNRITALAADGPASLWFTTDEGSLHHLRDGRLVATIAIPGAGSLVGVLRARDGSIWTQGANGAVRRTASGVTREILPERGIGRFRGLCARGDGLVCAAVRDEVVLLDPNGTELARMSAPSTVCSLAPDGETGLWVGLPDGIARAREGEVARFPVSPDPGRCVQVVAAAGPAALWLGTPTGVVRVSTTSDRIPAVNVRSPVQLPSGFDVRSILVDREGNVWTGGSEAGLVRLRPCRVEQFESVPGQSQVSAICDDGEGGAWVGYRNRGLCRIWANGKEVDVLMRPSEASPPSEVRALLRDRRGRTWLGVDTAWMRFDPSLPEGFVPLLRGRSSDAVVGPMAEAADGVWISTQAGKLLRVGPDDAVAEELDAGSRVHALAVAPDGALWIGCADHVARAHGGRIERFGAEAGVPLGSVRDVAFDARGGTWIATYGGGVALLEGGRARKLTSAHGLVDSSISRLLFDGDGRLWMHSNLGLMVAARSELVDVLDGRRARIEPVVIGSEAGMNEASPGGPAGFADASGGMWFGTISGTTRIAAADFPFNRTPPRARMRAVRADDAVLEPHEGLEVPAGTRRLQLDFTTYAYAAPERIRFRYRLDGWDDDWVEGRERSASYTALSPGPYVFRVMARNEDGVWSTEPEVLRLELLAAWWQTAPFRAALVLLAMSALFALHRLRIGIVQRRAEALLDATHGRVLAEERSSRLREELAHVARVATAGELATSLAHEVNQPLAAIVTNAEAARRYLARDGTSSAELDVILRDIAQQGERASEVIKRLRQFLRKHETERTEVDMTALVHQTLPLVRRELEDLDAAVELDLEAEMPSIAADPVQIQQVLVNLIKNACDALKDHAGEHRIRLVTRRTAGGVVLEVHDTGPGIPLELRDRLFQPYFSTKPTGMGLGLPICRTIVEAHGGRMALVTAGTTGTAFRVDLPRETRKNGGP